MANKDKEVKPEVPEVKPETQIGVQPEAKPEIVEVPKSQFDQLMTDVAKLKSDNEALTFAADRSRLQAFQERQKTPGNRQVKLLTYLGEDGARKVILAWKKVKDDVYKAANGAWVEDQIMEVIFEDDTKLQLPLLSFFRNTADKLKAEVLEDKGESFKVKTEEGKEYLVGKMFVN